MSDIEQKELSKFDPVAEALMQMNFVLWKDISEHADDIRAALDAGGFEIRNKPCSKQEQRK